jgi:hypothetical protein
LLLAKDIVAPRTASDRGEPGDVTPVVDPGRRRTGDAGGHDLGEHAAADVERVGVRVAVRVVVEPDRDVVVVDTSS